MIYTNNKKRNVILLILIGIFLFVFSAFAVLMINGKSFGDGGLVTKGVIRINSIPDDVDIFVNGKETRKNGDLLQNLDLGNNTIQVSKEGYSNWEKVVNVKPNVVSDIYVQLYPLELNLEQLTTLNIDEIAYLNNNKVAFFTVLQDEEPQNLGIWKYDFSSNLISLGTTKPEQFTNFSSNDIDLLSNGYEIKISENLEKILITTNSNNSFIYSNNQPKIDIKSILGFYPTSIKWLKNDTNLIIRNADLLYDFNIDNNSKNLISYFPDKNPIFCNVKNTVYYVEDGGLWKYENDETSSLRKNELLFNSGVKLICPKENKDSLVLQNNSGLVYINFEEKFTSDFIGNGSVVDFSPNGEALLADINGDLFSYEFDKKLGKIELIRKRVERISENANYRFSNNSSSLVIWDIYEESLADLYLSDIDGENIQELLKGQEIIEGSFFINGGEELFLVLNSAIQVNQIKNHNLYKIILN